MKAMSLINPQVMMSELVAMLNSVRSSVFTEHWAEFISYSNVIQNYFLEMCKIQIQS